MMIQANSWHVSLLFSKIFANSTRIQLKRKRNEEPSASFFALYNIFFHVSYRPKDGRWRKHAAGSGTGSINVINDYFKKFILLIVLGPNMTANSYKSPEPSCEKKLLFISLALRTSKNCVRGREWACGGGKGRIYYNFKQW